MSLETHTVTYKGDPQQFGADLESLRSNLDDIGGYVKEIHERRAPSKFEVNFPPAWKDAARGFCRKNHFSW